MFLQISTGIIFLMKCHFYNFFFNIVLKFISVTEQNFLFDFIYYIIGFEDAFTQNLICILQFSTFFILFLLSLKIVKCFCGI